MMQNLVCTAFLAAALAAEVPQAQPPVSETATPAPVKPTMDLLVELSSSKSKIWKIVRDSEDLFKMVKDKSVKTPVTINGAPFKKGLGAACNYNPPQEWSTEDKCNKHIKDLKTNLLALTQTYTISSLRFLATAGLRQSKQKVDTMKKLQDVIDPAMEPHMAAGSPDIEYRPLSGEEEAENEFLAMMMLLRKAKLPFKGYMPVRTDRLEEDEPLAVIGLGGGSLQYGLLNETEAAKSTSKTLLAESVQGGLDKIYADIKEVNKKSNETFCKIEYEALPDKMPKKQAVYDECKKQIEKIASFSALGFKGMDKVDLTNPEHKVYVIGGINYAIKDIFGKMKVIKECTTVELEGDDEETVEECTAMAIENVWEKTIKQVRAGAIDKCEPYEGKHPTNSYYNELCFKLTYLVHLLTSFGVPEDKHIQFRFNVDGSDAQWPRAAVFKETCFSDDTEPPSDECLASPGFQMLQPYDTKTITNAAVSAWQTERDAPPEVVEEEEGEESVPEGSRLI